MSIRTRLLLILVAFTLLPILVSGTILVYTTRASSLQRQQTALNLVADLKQNQLQSWLDNLQSGLETEIARDASTGRMNSLLRSPGQALAKLLHDRQVENFQSSIDTFHTFDEIYLLDPNGKVILSTNPDREGRNFWLSAYFQNGMSGPTIEVDPPQLPGANGAPASDLSITAALPIESASGQVLGVIAGHANLEVLRRIIADRSSVGEGGEIYLVGSHNLPLTALLLPPPGSTGTDAGTPTANTGTGQAIGSLAIQTGMEFQTNGSARYTNYAGQPVVGAYRWVQDMGAVLIAEQNEAVAMAVVNNARNITLYAALFSLVVAIAAASLISRSFTRPLEELAATAEKIASGNLELRAPSGRMDEIGALAIAFNSMTAQLRVLIGNLEARVSERTRLLQNRSDQLQASVEVGRFATNILDSDILIQRTVDLIRERFGLYYVGLFLVDESRQWAVLRAGTGRAGQAMLQRGHRLPLSGTATDRRSESSMIGWAIINNQARVALQVEQDPMRTATPELPETRSEAAIPLRSRGQILGAITLQSATPGAFDKETINILQTMADQVATALDNARLFNQAQKALEEARQSYSQIGHQAWQERLRARPVTLRHQSQPRSGQELALADPSPADGDGAPISVSIRARGRVIGRLRAARRPAAPDKFSTDGPANPQEMAAFSQEEIGLLETLVDQLGVALDSARLFEQTQQQAERERLVGEVTSRLRASLDLQTVIRTAASEFRAALALDEVELRLSAADLTAQPDAGSKPAEKESA